MLRVRANQKAERPVSTRPLSGISVGSTTSNVEIRSVATRSRRSSSSANSSRTFPLPTWVAASGMDRLLSRLEGVETVEDQVDVAGVGAEVEDLGEGGLAQPFGDLGIGACEVAEVAAFVPGARGEPLHDPIRVVAREAALDQREQESLAEIHTPARFEIGEHPLRIDDEAFEQPCKPIQDVVQAEEDVREHDPLGRGV